MSTGGRLRTERKKLKITQGEMAKRIGVSLSTISDIERGKIKSVTPRLANLLHEAYGIDPHWLMYGNAAQFTPLTESIKTVFIPSTEYSSLPDRITLSPIETEIILLYLTLDKETRQQVLTEFAYSIAKNKDIPKPVITAFNGPAKHSRPTEHDTEFASDILPVISSRQYFDQSGLNVSLTENEVLETEKAISKRSKGQKKKA
ncbi:MAG: helix-turn-helix domain-containing protein [Defluviitaleaceae bacterium]|nr:helix-turn-helix domain-containing protein [Defluviitaleaceae bacterium]MCL2835190.1 helix-turn-helix domain-containing protein [Defluviitaleaceae bacterium]